MKLSATISCYYEEKTIDEFHRRLSATLDAMDCDYEIIYVDDGSTDGTWERLKAIYNESPKVQAILKLFKNSGQGNAIMAAITEATGDVILTLDSDLQLDPEELPELYEAYLEGHDIISGYRKNRSDSMKRTLPSRLANGLMRFVTGTDVRDFGCTFKLYNSKLIRAFDIGPSTTFNQVNYIAQAGSIKEIGVTHHERKVGSSGWTFRKLWDANMDILVIALERIFQFVAQAAIVLALLFVLRLVIGFLFPFSVLDTITNGFILNVVVITFLLLLFVLSIQGEYASRVYKRSRNIPTFIVKERLVRET